jgi:PIN domain nuclease of toxin-antitoxin system
VNSILDSSAMVAYLTAEPGGSVVKALLEDKSEVCHAHSVNLCEVFYHYVRLHGETTARQVIDDLLAEGLVERCDLDRAYWERVGTHKARGRIALGHFFCLALAQELNGQVVTSDHGEFDPLVPLGICPITFIR